MIGVGFDHNKISCVLHYSRQNMTFVELCNVHRRIQKSLKPLNPLSHTGFLSRFNNAIVQNSWSFTRITPYLPYYPLYVRTFYISFFYQAPIQGSGWGGHMRLELTLLFHVLPRARKQQQISNPPGRETQRIHPHHHNQKINHRPQHCNFQAQSLDCSTS